MTGPGLLSIYLNDHLAGATVGVELSRRAAASNRDGEFGPFLRSLATEIEEDRQSLRTAMHALEVKPDLLKPAIGWLGEKVGRFKPNGSLIGYSPLSRVVELEGLTLGVTGKLGLWLVLQGLDDARLAEVDLDGLIARARRQRDDLERHRARAAELSFT